MLFGSQSIEQILGGLEVLDQDGGHPIAMHASLFDVKIRRLVRCEQDIIVRRILMPLELIWRDVSTEMIVTSGGKMAGAEHLLILDVSS